MTWSGVSRRLLAPCSRGGNASWCSASASGSWIMGRDLYRTARRGTPKLFRLFMCSAFWCRAGSAAREHERTPRRVVARCSRRRLPAVLARDCSSGLSVRNGVLESRAMTADPPRLPPGRSESDDGDEEGGGLDLQAIKDYAAFV